MTPTTLPALLAAELDSIDSDADRARRAAELLRAMAESWPDTYDSRGYRVALLNAADDLEGDADLEDDRQAQAAAEDECQRREALQRRRELMGCAFLAVQVD